MPTAYFLGAGASKADGFPLTRELLGAVGSYLFPPGRTRGRDLLRFLEVVYGCKPSDWRTAGARWRRSLARAKRGDAAALQPPDNLPDLTDLLSALDVLLLEQGTVGGGKRGAVLRGTALASARAHIMRAIASGIAQAHEQLAPARAGESVNTRFVTALSPRDLLVTTNWDILLDRAHRRRFGTTQLDYGTDAVVENNARPRQGSILDPAERLAQASGKRLRELRDERPRLLKLHGSVNWLHCPRCSRLVIDVPEVIAQLGLAPGNDHGIGRARACACAAPLEAMLVTPTFVKNYRSRHLLNIWAAAQAELAAHDNWVFIGYSLPADDIHIKTLLLKARQMRQDDGKRPNLKVTVVTHRRSEQLEQRFRQLFGQVDFENRGFERFVTGLEAIRKKKNRAVHKIAKTKLASEQVAEARRRERNRTRRRRRRQAHRQS